MLNGKFPAHISEVQVGAPHGAEWLHVLNLEVALDLDGSVANSGSLFGIRVRKGWVGGEVMHLFNQSLSHLAHSLGAHSVSNLKGRSVYAVYENSRLSDVVFYNLLGDTLSLAQHGKELTKKVNEL